ncbi:hypothetical protein CPB86DRAFT_784939 [Serendipita vermifera]|nr:hypothetical protein CPB86DRAFT_784939 [Serendipita vermifera]
MTSAATRLTPLRTSSLKHSVSQSDNESTSSAEDILKTPLSSESPENNAMFMKFTSTKDGSASLCSSKASSYEDEPQSSDSSDSGSSTNERMEPVFSALPARRAHSSGAIARGSGMNFPCAMTSITPSENSSAFPRRIPSFPVSKPIRPFDSISNAMGNNTAAKRTLSPVEARPSVVEKPAIMGKKDIPLRGLDEKPKPKRSNKLLEPPKNNRFQNGFFILDMTQDEFKSRAW